MKLFSKIFICVFVSFVAVFFLISYFISVKQISDVKNDIIEDNKTLGRFLAREIEVGYLQARWPFEGLKKLSEQRDFLFWWLVRDDGIIHLANDVAFMGTKAHSHYPQIAKITGEENVVLELPKNYGIFIKTVSIEKKKWLFCLGFSLKEISEMKKEIILLDTGVSALGVVILGFLLYFTIAYLTKPIKELSWGAEIIGKGNLAHRVKVISHDELGELANSFNKMAEDLQKITVSRDDLAKEIAERKRAEETLKASENKYRTLVENLPQKVFIKDKNSIYLSCNASYAQDLKIRPEDISGKTDYDFYPKELAEKYRADDKRIMEAGNTEDIEEKYIQDGQEVIVHTVKTPVKDENGNTIGILGIFWDITERKKVEEEIKESEQRFRHLFDNARDGIILADQETRQFYMANKAICKMLGYNEDELKRLGVKDIHLEKDLPYAIEQFERLAHEEIVIVENLPVKRRDASIFYADVVGTLLILGGKKYLMGNFRDITERKLAEEALKDYTRQIEKVNKELDDFTYIVSHDLKEPLRSIDAFSKFIVDDYKDKLNGEGRSYLERIRINANRMQNLIEDLLEISRIERKIGTFEEVEVEGLVNEVQLRLEYAIKQKNAQIIIQDKLPKVFCDRVRLTEVFLNLISNALKFNDKPNPRIEIGANLKDVFYEFWVKDNGPGIEEQYFDKIFEIFQRLNKREEHEGTGAGLTIAKKIVQMHKGKIWVESKVGEGATFYFTIPKKKDFILGKKKIGEILVEKKLIDEEEVKKALEEQEKMGV